MCSCTAFLGAAHFITDDRRKSLKLGDVSGHRVARKALRMLDDRTKFGRNGKTVTVIDRVRSFVSRCTAPVHSAYFRPTVISAVDRDLLALVERRVTIQFAGIGGQDGRFAGQRLYRVIDGRRSCVRPQRDFDFLD